MAATRTTRLNLALIAATLFTAAAAHGEPPSPADLRRAVEGNVERGVPLEKYEQKKLRAQIGVVLQDPLLFQGTIAENIAYGHPRASRQEVIAAAPEDRRNPYGAAAYFAAAGETEAAFEWLERAFAKRGFHTQRIPTSGNPALFAERRNDAAGKTVLVYLQADGQPVDPSAWAQANPFIPVLKERDDAGNWQQLPWEAMDEGFDPDWRIFARSASDSKGPMTQFMIAMELLDDLGSAPSYNLKVIIDTEEELGSPNLAQAIREHRDLLASDLLLIFDGPPHASNRPTVTFGARGIMGATLVTYGPRVAQHSGHYGNFVPNPAFDLARILASVKSPDGVVTIPGFYDGVSLSDDDRSILSSVPDDEDEILAGMGVARAESVAPTLQEAIQYPSLNIRGMSAAWVGEQARTVIPPAATAELDIRLVKESDPERLISLLRAHIESLGYTVLDRAPTDEERRRHDRIVSLTYDVSYGAFRSGMDTPAGRMARAGRPLPRTLTAKPSSRSIEGISGASQTRSAASLVRPSL